MDKLRKILNYLLLATALVPIVYLQAFYSPFLTTKVLLFRVLVEVALALFLFLLYKNSAEFNLEILKKKITWTPAILLVICYAAGILGLDFYNSFWSDFVRMEGLLTMTHLVVFFYLSLLVFKDKDWLIYIKILTVAGLIAGLYGLGQRAGVSFLAETGLDRAAGTLGNAAFLASYLIFSAFFSLFLIVRQEASKRWFWYLCLIVSLVGIIYSGTRGAVLAIIGALFIYFVYNVLFGEGKKKKTYAGVFLGIIVLAGVFGFVGRETLKESDISIVRRFANIGEGDATTQSRLFVWKNALSYVKDKPLLGYGVENFAQVYDKFYDPTYVQEDWFDRTHNIYLDYAFSSGVLGLLAYLIICGYILFSLFKKSREEKEFRVLFFMFIAYMIQNFFVFDSVSTMIVFYFFFGYVVTQNYSEVNTFYLDKKFLRPVYIVVALLAIYSIYPSVFVPMRVNYALSQGYLYQMVDVNRSIESMQDGLSYDTFAFKDYAYQNYQIFINQVSNPAFVITDLQKSYDFARSVMKDAIDKRPYDVRLYTYFVSIYESTKQRGLSFFVDLDESETLIKRAIEMAPKRPELRFMLANIYTNRATLATGAAEKLAFEELALGVLKDYDAQVPETATTKLILANILFNMGRLSESGVYFDLAIEKYEPNESDAQKIISFYLRKEEYAKTIPYYEYLVSREQANYNLVLDLAQAYYAAGEFEKSYQAIQTIQAKSPEILNLNPEFVNLVLSLSL